MNSNEPAFENILKKVLVAPVSSIMKMSKYSYKIEINTGFETVISDWLAVEIVWLFFLFSYGISLSKMHGLSYKTDSMYPNLFAKNRSEFVVHHL